MLLRRISLPSLIQYVALLVMGVIMTVDLYTDGGPWWLAAILCVGLAVIYDHWPGGRYDHVYFVFQLAFTLALISLHPVSLMAGFALSAEVMAIYPNRSGWRWLAALICAVIGVMVWRYDVLDGGMLGLGAGLGYISFGYFSYARAEAVRERKHSQELLAELQAAHRQLRDYADHAEELAVQVERTRLAREMHDTLGHRLTVAAVQLEGAQRLVETDPQRAGQMIAVVRTQVSEALADLRRTVAALRLPLEVDLPLETALARLAHGFETSAAIPVHLSLPPQPLSLSGPQRLALYRAAQEGLTNIQRHAHARQAWLDLAQSAAGVQLTVADDGSGPASTAPAGFGLRGLRERAELLGGVLEFGARPGGGAELRFQVPGPAVVDNAGNISAMPAADRMEA